MFSADRLSWLKWPITLAAVCGLLTGAFFVNKAMKAERTEESAGDTVEARKRVEHGVVRLTEEEVTASGIVVAQAEEIQWSEPVTVYGRVVPNPNATTTIQAPFTGTLETYRDVDWPSVGSRIEAGQPFGALRLRVDLQVQAQEAHIKVEGAEKIVAIHQERVARLEKASKGSEIVSQRELDDARVSLREARTNLTLAEEAEKQWRGALELQPGSGLSVYRHVLKSPLGGEVVEVPGRPTTAVESGAAVMRLVDFSRPLVQVDLPPEIVAEGPPVSLDLTLLPARPEHRIDNSLAVTAKLRGTAPLVDTTTQFSSFWYEAALSDDEARQRTWRPGRFMIATIRGSSREPRSVIAIPESALLIHDGRYIVYVRVAAGAYQRREVTLLGKEGARAIVALLPRRNGRSGLGNGEAVVSEQAQVLLSEEFKSAGAGER